MRAGPRGAGGIVGCGWDRGVQVGPRGARPASRTSLREAMRERQRGLVPPPPQEEEKGWVPLPHTLWWFLPTLCVALPPTWKSDPGTWSSGDLSPALAGHQALG